MAVIRVMTVREPWATAFFLAGKDVENRAKNIAGRYRGPVAVCAATKIDEDAMRDYHRALMRKLQRPLVFHPGAVLGVVDLVEAHQVVWDSHGEDDCVDPVTRLSVPCPRAQWAEPGMCHLYVSDPRLLPRPFPTRGTGLGRLGLTMLDTECRTCDGTGRENTAPGAGWAPCPACRGSGETVPGLTALLGAGVACPRTDGKEEGRHEDRSPRASGAGPASSTSPPAQIRSQPHRWGAMSLSGGPR